MRAFSRGWIVSARGAHFGALLLLLGNVAMPQTSATGDNWPALPRLQPAALREDFAIARAALEEGHAGLYRFTPRAEMDRLFEREASGLTKPMTVVEFQRPLARVIAAIKDVHTAVRLPPAMMAQLDSQIRVIPFQVKVLQRRLYVFRDFSDSAGGLAGQEIMSINGVPMALTVPTKYITEYTKGLDIPHHLVDGNDVSAVYAATKDAVDWARAGRGPTVIEGMTYRWYDHAGFAGGYIVRRELEEMPGRGLRVQIDPGDETFVDALAGEQRQSPADQFGDLLIRDRDDLHVGELLVDLEMGLAHETEADDSNFDHGRYNNAPVKKMGDDAS